MKTFFILLCFLAAHQGFAKELSFTASTPAGPQVRDFLGISQTDSVDFIRWDLKISEMKTFSLSCSYGIGKPNTNGFIDEMKAVANGAASMNNGVITLRTGSRSLSFMMINSNILHILDTNGRLMAGNDGWSYTLNAIQLAPGNNLAVKPGVTVFKDSVVFSGRTPCRNIEELLYNKTREECYKKKWIVSLYKSTPGATSGNYKIGSTAASMTGKWKLKEDQTGKIIYSLDLNNGNSLDLLQADENIVYFLDKNGKPMVGDLDFSYSLTRRAPKPGAAMKSITSTINK